MRIPGQVSYPARIGSATITTCWSPARAALAKATWDYAMAQKPSATVLPRSMSRCRAYSGI